MSGRPFKHVGEPVTIMGVPFDVTYNSGDYYIADAPLSPGDIDLLDEHDKQIREVVTAIRDASYAAEVHSFNPSTIYMSGAHPINLDIWVPGDALDKGDKVYVIEAEVLGS